MASLQGLPSLLGATLHPATAKEAEKSLRLLEPTPGFAPALLELVTSDAVDSGSRLAGAILFKNFVRTRYIDENGNYLIAEGEVALIKSTILDAMLLLPLEALRLQLIELVLLIAELDFPHRWDLLVTDLVLRLLELDWNKNRGVLAVAHSIFKRWRPLFPLDDLFLEIQHVLQGFQEPFLQLLLKADTLLADTTGPAAAPLWDCLLLLTKIYYDLNCQDIPEFFETHMKEGMAVMHKYLGHTSSDAQVTAVRYSICELITLYATRYAEDFAPLTKLFVETVWGVLTLVLGDSSYDMLVAKALQFMDAVVKLSEFTPMFALEQALTEIVERILLPNVRIRDLDVEMFEDEPIEYIRRDLDEGSDTRRAATTEFLRLLKDLVDERLVTNVTMKYTEQFMESYTQNPARWQDKDTAVYLYTAVAAKGAITGQGVTSTNMLLDIVGFFTLHIAKDLVAPHGLIHPLLKVDAIHFLYVFRNQLTKQQLVEAFGMLAQHLDLQWDYVVYTYTAITIEKILLIHKEGRLVFSRDDVVPIAGGLLTQLFQLITLQSSPERLAENEYLIKCVMRVLVLVEGLPAAEALACLQQLLAIIKVLATNPSNPRFSHYTFESIGLLVRWLSVLMMEVLVPELLPILSSDVQEFVPYVFQILAYMLEKDQGTLPPLYAQLAKPLMLPTVWEYRGNIPGVTRLLQAIVAKDPLAFQQPAQLEPLLGVFQKLIASKMHEQHGFELLTTVVLHIPGELLKPYTGLVATLLLQRLLQLITERFVRRFTVWVCTVAIKLGPEWVYSVFELVQPGVFGQVLSLFVLGKQTAKVANLLDKKVIAVGLAVLAQSPAVGERVPAVLAVLAALVLLELVGDVKTTTSHAFDAEYEFEEISFGSNFSKLVGIQPKVFDPVPEVASSPAAVRAEVVRRLAGVSMAGVDDQVRAALS